MRTASGTTALPDRGRTDWAAARRNATNRGRCSRCSRDISTGSSVLLRSDTTRVRPAATGLTIRSLIEFATCAAKMCLSPRARFAYRRYLPPYIAVHAVTEIPRPDSRRARRARVTVAMALFLSPMASGTTDPCDGFTWDVLTERALFATEPTTLVAGTSVATAPMLEVGRLYEVALHPRERVTFAAKPERAKNTEGETAGVARLTVSKAGLYRIAADSPIWIDVVKGGGTLVQSSAFQGRRASNAPHKLVEFAWPANEALCGRWSGAGPSRVRVSITSSPVTPAGKNSNREESQ